MNKLFGFLAMVLVSVLFFSCAPAKFTEAMNKPVDQDASFQMDRDHLFEVLLAISSGDIDGKVTHGDPIEFQKFFSEKKDLIQSVGVTEAELKAVFRDCIFYVVFYREGQGLNDYDLLKMKNFKFLIHSLGEETLLDEGSKTKFGDFFEKFDDTRKMILAKL